MQITIGFELETRAMTFCRQSLSQKTIYNPHSKANTFLQETAETILQVSPDFIPSLHEEPPVQQRSNKTFIKFLQQHQDSDRYAIHFDSQELWIRNNAQYNMLSIFRDAEFDILIRPICRLQYVTSLPTFLWSSLQKAIIAMKLYLHSDIQEFPIQNKDFPYSSIWIPKKDNESFLFLSTLSRAQLSSMPFQIQCTLGIEFKDASSIISYLFAFFKTYTESDKYEALRQRVQKGTGAVIQTIINQLGSALDAQQKSFLNNYVFLFLYSFNTRSENRKYNSLVLVRHPLNDLQLLLSDSFKTILSEALKKFSVPVGEYFDLIHSKIRSAKQAMELEFYKDINLFPLKENKIYIEFRGFHKILKEVSGGNSLGALENFLADK